MELLKNNYYYDDIYPAILKQQSSHFKMFFSDLYFRFTCLWHRAA